MKYGTTDQEKNNFLIEQWEKAIKGYNVLLNLAKCYDEAEDKDTFKASIKDSLIAAAGDLYDPLFQCVDLVMKRLLNDYECTDTTIKLCARLDEYAQLHSEELCPNGRDKYSRIEKVDFNRLVDSKVFRNDYIHYGVIEFCRHYYSVFRSLRIMLQMVIPDRDFVLPENKTVSESEIYNTFKSELIYESKKYDNYILIVDSTWDIADEHIKDFLSLGWDMIIDVDGRRGGDYSNTTRTKQLLHELEAENRLDNRRVELLTHKSDQNDILQLAARTNCLPYINLSDGQDNSKITLDLSTDHTYRAFPMLLRKCDSKDLKRLTKGQNVVKEKMDFLKECLRRFFLDNPGKNSCAIVCLAEVFDGINANFLYDVIDSIYDYFSQWVPPYIMLAENKQDYKDNSMYWFDFPTTCKLNCDASDFCRFISKGLREDESTNIFLNSMDYSSYYRFPSDNGEEILIEKSNQYLNIPLDYFDFLDLNVSDELIDDEVLDFYKGEYASWGVIAHGRIVNLVSDNEVEQFIHKIMSSLNSNASSSHVFRIEHEPGIGGTTFGRMIAWKLHYRLPVLILKKYDYNIGSVINNLYDTVLQRTPFVIIMDTINGITVDDISNVNEIINRRSDSLRPIVGLIVSRAENNSRTQHNIKNILKLGKSRIDSRVVSALVDNCKVYAKRYYSDKEIDERIMKLNNVLSQEEKYPLIINLYIMDNRFTSPKEHVKHFFEGEGDDQASENIKFALKLIALYSYYNDNIKITTNVISKLCFSNNDVHFALSKYNDLLLYDYRKPKRVFDKPVYDGVSCKHPLFAKEIMIYGENNSFDDAIPYVAKKIVTGFIEMIGKQTKISKNEAEVLKILLARKSDNSTSIMTPVIMDIRRNVPKDGLDILLLAANTIKDYIDHNCSSKDNPETEFLYGLLSRLWAQCARHFSIKYNWEPEVMEEVDKYTNLSLELIPSDKIHHMEYADLYHMAGLVNLKKLKNIFWDDITLSDDTEEMIQNLYYKTHGYFYGCLSCGSFDYAVPYIVETSTVVLDNMYRLLGLDSEESVNAALDNPKHVWLNDVIDDALDIDDDTNNILDFLNDIATKEFNAKINEFYSVYYRNQSGRYIEITNNTIERAKQQSNGGYVIKKCYKNILRYLLSGFIETSKEKKKRYVNYKKLFNDKNAHDKFSKYINEALEYSENDPWIYKLWFKLAKYDSVDFSQAKQMVVKWKCAINNSGTSKRRKYVEPYYYDYVISLLSGCSESEIDTADNELKNNLSHQDKYDRKVRDYLNINGKGMGMLYDACFLDNSDVKECKNISEVEGTIIICEKESEGYIDVEALKRFQSNRNLRRAFFSPKQNRIITTSMYKKVKLKVKFTYVRMEAVEESVIFDVPKINSHAEEPTGVVKTISINDNVVHKNEAVADSAPVSEMKANAVSEPNMLYKMTSLFHNKKNGVIYGMIEKDGKTYSAELKGVTRFNVDRILGDGQTRVKIKSQYEKDGKTIYIVTEC